MADVATWLPVAAFFVSAVVQGISGFGGSLVVMALLPLVWDIRQAVGVSAVFSLVLTVALAIKLSSHMQRKEVLPMVAAAFVGVPIGVTFLHTVEVKWVLATLGVILLAHSAWSLLFGAKASAIGRWAAPVAGLLGGALSGAFSTAGPPALVYATARGWPRDAFRANLQAFFLSTSVLSLAGFIATGVVTMQTLQTNLSVVPALIAGGWLGHKLSAKVDPVLFRKAVLVGLFLMGINYVVRAWA